MDAVVTSFIFILSQSVRQFKLVIRGRETIVDPQTKRVIATHPAVQAVFRDGQFVTHDPELADKLRKHPLFNKSFGLSFTELEAKVEDVAKDKTDAPLNYTDMTQAALRELCVEREVKSYGSKAEMIARLEEQDNAKVDPDQMALVEAIAKKYLKKDLVEMAEKAGVETKAEWTERELVIEMLAAGVDFDS